MLSLAVATICFLASIAQGGSDVIIVKGVVLSHDGKPVHGVAIYLDPPEGELPQHTLDWHTDRPDGLSRRDGRFSLSKPSGKYRLTVWIGRQRVHVLPIELKGGEQEIEIRLPKIPALHGKLVDQEGKPVPEMTVMLFNPETEERRLAVSDSKGEFAFLLPPPGKAKIHVIPPAGGEPLAQQEIVLSGDKDEDVTLKLTSMPKIVVKVLKSDGKPLVNAPLTVTVMFTTMELKTDSEGCVVLPLMPTMGKQKILLRSKGYGWAVATFEQVQTPSQPISIRLRPFASVSGKVVTPDNKPVANAEVRIQPVTLNPFPFGNLEQAVRTGEQGQFKVDELWAGNYSLDVVSEGYRLPGPRQSLYVAPGQHKTVNITVVPVKKHPTSAATISGQVLDAEGKPVAEATVQLNKQLASPWDIFEVRPSESVKTDNEGKFVLTNVSSGWHALSARTKDGKDAVCWVYVPPIESDKQQQISVTLKIPKEFGSIKGKVFKDGGKTPASGVGVMAIESHYYLVNLWGTEQAAMHLQVDENQKICIGGG